MSDTKHEPFLWLNDNEESAKSNDGMVILEGGSSPAVFLRGPYAVAPELLGVCVELQSVLDEDELGTMPIRNFKIWKRAVRQHARVVLAKAKGHEQ